MRRRSVIAGLVVVAAVLTGRFTICDPVRVSSASMAPTVCAGDVVVVNHLAPRRGLAVDDIVTFPHPTEGTEQIKRIVALGGQSVAIADAQLLVDNKVVVEPYVDASTIDGVYFGPVTVADGAVFVMGDARELSIDSRTFGAIPVDAVDGRMVGTLWSTDCSGPR